MKKVLVYLMFFALIAAIPNFIFADEATGERYKICGYLTSDVKNNIGTSNSGFKVSIKGTDIEAYTDNVGYFEFTSNFESGKNSTVIITKDKFLRRSFEISPVNDMMIGSLEVPLNMWSGDLNSDNTSNMADLVILASYFNTLRGDGNYSDEVDLNDDGAVNMSDVVIVAKNFNKTSGDYTKPELRNLSQAVLTPYWDYYIKAGDNIVFCPTFQIAWDALKKDVGGDVALSGKPAMADYLNKGINWKSSISEDSYVAMSGFGDETVELINTALKSKFGDDAPSVGKIGPGSYISYAYLLKNMKFAKVFEDTAPINFRSNGTTTQINSFGITIGSDMYKDLSKQVQVYDYKSDDDFIVKLLPENTNEEIILAKVEPDATLHNTYEKVADRIENSKPSDIGFKDSLRIPEVDVKVYDEFEELHDAINNQSLAGFNISKACQNVKFTLNKRGASLASEALILATPSIVKTKQLVFDKQFMICLKEKEAENPYLIIWVDNPDILAKSTN